MSPYRYLTKWWSPLCLVNAVFFLTLFGCVEPQVRKINPTKSSTYLIETGYNNKPFSLNEKAKETRYVFLENSPSEINDVDKLCITGKFIYILDKNKNKLSIFDRQGKYVEQINEVTAFEIYQGRELYSYNHKKGWMTKMSANGKFISRLKIGFRGLDFVKLDEKNFIFHTGGLVTDDLGSTDYEIAQIDLTGKFRCFFFPIDNAYKGINYVSANRFTKSGNEIFFIPTFSNAIYKISVNNIYRMFSFDFGNYNLSRAEFLKIREVEDYDFFPLVLNLECKFVDKKFIFFTYTFKGNEGYILFDKTKNVICATGLGNITSNEFSYANIIPIESSDNNFVSVVSQERLKKIVEKHSLLKKKRDSSGHEISSNLRRNPGLIFFSLHP